ncbi:MAG: bifunctional serine/threonine-protein kinase/formylglycine-generating enzyme family protein [Polyangiaceae bacterium]
MSEDAEDASRLEAAAEVGSIFGGDFRVLRELRSGGMGQLYTVERLSTGGTFVLKLMPPELARHRPARERFAREAKAMASLSSPHSVDVIASGIDEPTGAPFIVMELLEGEDLADAIDRCGALPIVDVMQILTEVAEALQEAHVHGIVHRDLKPENIFLVRFGGPDGGFVTKLLDFGVAKFISAADAVVGTQPVGSPLFMAPEQADSLGPITPATDVWAFGLLAFLLLTGRHFWLGAENGSVPGLLRESILDPLVPASERAARFDVNVALPTGFDDWFGSCVNRDPSRRFQSVMEAVLALEEVVSELLSSDSVVEDGDALPTDRPLAQEQKEPAVEPPLPTEPAPISSVRPTLASPSPLALSQPIAPPTPAPQSPPEPLAPPRNTRTTPSGIVIPEALRASVGTGVQRRSWRWFSSVAAVAIAIGAGIVAAKVSSHPDSHPAHAADEDVVDASPSSSARAAEPVRSSVCAEGTALVEPASGPSFCMDTTECSVARFERAVPRTQGKQGATRPHSAFDAFCNAGRERDAEPANCLSAEDAAQACGSFGGRLPTVEEWHAAAKSVEAAPAREGSANTCGDECAEWGLVHRAFVDAFANSRDPYPGTAPVASFSVLGGEGKLLALDGNVAEWTKDESGGAHIVCGASFLTGPRSADADCHPASPRTPRATIGFRCVYAPLTAAASGTAREAPPR